MSDVIKQTIFIKLKFFGMYFFISTLAYMVVKMALTPFMDDLPYAVVELITTQVITLFFAYVFMHFSPILQGEYVHLRHPKIKIAELMFTIGTCVLFYAMYYGINVIFVQSSTEQSILAKNIFFESYAGTLGIFIILCIVSPIIEEWLCRGWLFQKLEALPVNPKVPLLLNGFVFSALHSQYANYISFVTLFYFGFYLAWIRRKFDNLIYCVIAHAIFNGFGFFAMWYYF